MSKKDRAMVRRFMLFTCIIIPMAVSVATVRADGGRNVISLDGTWQIAEGAMDDVPKSFDRQTAVPGLADMAVPAFEGVGPKDLSLIHI